MLIVASLVLGKTLSPFISGMGDLIQSEPRLALRPYIEIAPALSDIFTSDVLLLASE